MAVLRRHLPFVAAAAAIVFLLIFYSNNVSETWRALPQAVGMGEALKSEGATLSKTVMKSEHNVAGEDRKAETSGETSTAESWKPQFAPGIPKPAGESYSRTLVITRTRKEDVSWIEKELPGLNTAIYVADDPNAPLHPTKNKGHESTVYLTYIIDNYESLPDISIFMHAHQFTWHNNDLLERDAAEMVRRLSSARVTREGYMNLRCHWGPGCPEWMHPGAVEKDRHKPEEIRMAKAWAELFPFEPIPSVLAQACCSQFAVSRERIRALPRSRYVYFRDWMLRTPLSDAISGRVWEYLWHAVFTGEAVHCPAVHVCYCDGYGVCFGGSEQFDAWSQDQNRLYGKESELEEWRKKDETVTVLKEGKKDKAGELDVPEPGLEQKLQEGIDEMKKDLEQRRQEALRRGQDPRLRAEEVGRQWKEGDGF